MASHFGQAMGFMIFHVENGKVISNEFRPNTFTGHALGLAETGNAHHHHGPILPALSDCQAVISHGMGRRIFDDLCNAGIDAIITDEENIERAIALYVEGKLINRPELGCQHHHK